jgi:hypothetical protein
MGVNAFDEPNVAESKEITRRVLEEYAQGCKLPEVGADFSQNGITFHWDAPHGKHDTLEGYVQEFLDQTQPHDYISWMAYLTHSPASDRVFTASRVDLRARYHVAPTLGYGPRFMHSTGQLHKGGPNEGVFIQVTSTPPKDANIPGEDYTFTVLMEAQALGDLKALQNHNRRVMRLHIAEGTDLTVLQDLIRSTVQAPKTQERADGKASVPAAPQPAAANQAAASEPVAVNKTRKATREKGAARKTNTTGRRTARTK